MFDMTWLFTLIGIVLTVISAQTENSTWFAGAVLSWVVALAFAWVTDSDVDADW